MLGPDLANLSFTSISSTSLGNPTKVSSWLLIKTLIKYLYEMTCNIFIQENNEKHISNSSAYFMVPSWISRIFKHLSSSALTVMW